MQPKIRIFPNLLIVGAMKPHFDGSKRRKSRCYSKKALLYLLKGLWGPAQEACRQRRALREEARTSVNKKSFPVHLLISLIIIAGFLLMGVTAYLSFRTLFKADIEAVSELTSENIYGNINNLMDRPIHVSLTMAYDTFLREFMVQEPSEGFQGEGLEILKAYLAAYQEEYQFDSVFLVSTQTNAYYHYKNGLDRRMTPGNPENTWYFDCLADSVNCSLNVDNDETTDENLVTIFVNCKIYDNDGALLGIVGVGIETPYMQTFLRESEAEYGVHAYLIDASGKVQLSSDWTEFEQVNLFENPVFADMAGSIRSQGKLPSQRWYHSRETDGYIITRYVPNLNWYLVVEKNTQEFQRHILAQLGLCAAFLLLIVLVVLKITSDIIRKYNRNLLLLAERDQLTGVRNRTSYEREILGYGAKLERYRQFGIGVFDLNNLKVTNDLYGHQAGDTYLKTFSRLLCDAFDHCPVFRIGGDEFAVIFLNLSEEEVWNIWNGLLSKIERQTQTGGSPISASFGCSFYDPRAPRTVEALFKDADDKMYLCKEQFRHKV